MLYNSNVLFVPSGFWFNLVDLMFCRIWSMWPLAVAKECGMCLAKFDRLIAGHVVKWFCEMACNQVDGTGEKQAACKNFIWSLILWGTVWTELADGVYLKDGTQVQRPFGVRVPVSTVWLLYLIMAWFLSNVAIHPWLHNFPMDRRLFCKVGKPWAWVAVVGRRCNVGNGYLVW